MAVIRQKGTDIAQPQTVVIAAVIARQEQTAEAGECWMVQEIQDRVVRGQVFPACLARVRELAARVYPRGVPKASDDRGLYVGRTTDDIVDAVTRLLDLMAQPEDADLLAPLVVDEILIRLLRTPIGNRIAQIGHTNSGVQRMADAVTWIRAHFAQPVTVEEMAASVHMSASSFHQRFKAVTTMSPLQYQKVLRLHEVRRLMLFQNMDASVACHRVGYLSASQFSREYSRFFGNAPSKDIARLREEGLGP